MILHLFPYALVLINAHCYLNIRVLKFASFQCSTRTFKFQLALSNFNSHFQSSTRTFKVQLAFSKFNSHFQSSTRNSQFAVFEDLTRNSQFLSNSQFATRNSQFRNPHLTKVCAKTLGSDFRNQHNSPNF